MLRSCLFRSLSSVHASPFVSLASVSVATFGRSSKRDDIRQYQLDDNPQRRSRLDKVHGKDNGRGGRGHGKTTWSRTPPKDLHKKPESDFDASDPVALSKQRSFLIRDARNFREVLRAIDRIAPELDAINLTIAISALRQYTRPVPNQPYKPVVLLAHPEFEKLQARLLEICHTIPARELSTIMHGLAKLSHHHPQLLEQLCLRARELAPQMGSQALCNIVYALSSWQHADSALIEALCQRLLTPHFLDDALPETLYILAYSLASLQVKDAAVMRTLAVEAIPRVPSFSAKGLANMAWAFAKLEMLHSPLFAAIAKEVVSRDYPSRAKHAAASASSSSSSSSSSSNAPSNDSPLTAYDVSQLSWAFAKLDIVDEALMRSLALSSIGLIGEFKPQDTGNVMWAFAKLGLRHDKLIDSLIVPLSKRISSYDAHSLCNVLWSLAVLQSFPLRTLALCLQRLGQLDAQQPITDETQLRQLQRLLLALQRFQNELAGKRAKFVEQEADLSKKEAELQMVLDLIPSSLRHRMSKV